MSEEKLWGLEPASIANEYGTPTYVINLDVVKRNFEALSRSLARMTPNSKLFYAVKANPLLRILATIKKLGGGAEVVSIGELDAGRRAGFDAGEILFNGPGKTAKEIELALELGLYSVNVESLDELALAEEIANRLGKTPRIGFRINPGIVVTTHKYLAVGFRGSKFGLDAENYRRALSRAAKSRSLSPVGIHMHVGSQISKISDFTEAYDKILKFAEDFEAVIGIAPQFIDIGGGIGLDYETGKPSISFDRLSRDGVSRLVRSSSWPNQTRLILEPGRALVGNAGVLMTRVLYVKKSLKMNWAIVDAGMNDFMRTALYGARHRIVNLSGDRGRPMKYMIGGPICESGDVFGEYELPRLKKGDLLGILDVGAYGSSMSNNYNGQLRPSTVVKESGSISLAERRETLDDMFERQQ